MTGYCEKKRDAASHHFDVMIPAEINSQKKFNARFVAKDSPSSKNEFFVYICDCFGEIAKSPKQLKIETTIKVLNSEEASSYSYSPSFRLLTQIVLPVAFFAYAILLAIIFITKKEKFNLAVSFEYPFIFLVSTIGMQLISILFLYVQSVIFRYNGRGFWLLDMFGHCWLMAGDSCCYLLMILLATGWGTFYIMFPHGMTNKINLVAMIVVFRYVWTIFGWYYRGGEEHGVHIFDGISGWLEILVGVVKYAIYLKVWWTGKLRTGPKNGIEIQHWRKFDNLIFLAAFISIVVRLVAIMSIKNFENAYHEAIGLIIALCCNFVMMLILTLLMAPKDGPYMYLSIANHELMHDHHGDQDSHGHTYGTGYTH